MTTLRPNLCLLGFALLATALPAQQTSTGPDVIVGALVGIEDYGPQNGMTAFAIGTTSCNIGDTPLPWDDQTPDHPVIATNLYRISNVGGMSRFEQIGVSWLKHGFGVLVGSECNPCGVAPGGGLLDNLPPGCSDPYGASLNGSQGPLGPRSDVNASTGGFNLPVSDPPFSGPLARRMQVDNTELDSALNPGARFLFEGHYITAADTLAGNGLNNVSWREANINGSGNNFSGSFTGSTNRQQSALEGWAVLEPDVALGLIDVPGDGRIMMGYLGRETSPGVFQHEFAIYNQNSHRSVRRVRFPVAPGTTVSNLEFHDVDRHSLEGEAAGVYDGTDWTPTQGPADVSWSTDTFLSNLNANALRWGSVYTYRFTTDMPLGAQATVELELFRPGPNPIQTISVTQAVSMSKVAGDTQGGNTGEAFQWPLVVRIEQGGTPIAGVPVNFSVTSGGGSITGLSVSNAGGFASATYTGGTAPGPVVVTATQGANTETFNLYSRRFIAIWNGFALITIFNCEYLGMPLALTFDDPLPAPGFVATPYGPLYSTVLAPGSGYGILDGIGFSGGLDPSLITNGAGSWSRIFPVANGGALVGITKVLQILGIPLPDVVMSSPVTINF